MNLRIVSTADRRSIEEHSFRATRTHFEHNAHDDDDTKCTEFTCLGITAMLPRGFEKVLDF